MNYLKLTQSEFAWIIRSLPVRITSNTTAAEVAKAVLDFYPTVTKVTLTKAGKVTVSRERTPRYETVTYQYPKFHFANEASLNEFKEIYL